VVVGAGCGVTSPSTCRKADERFPRHSVDVERALPQDGRLVVVEGVLFARRGRPLRLCSSDGQTSTLRCRQPSLRVEGLRDLAAFESVERRGAFRIVRSARIGGRVDGRTLRLTMSCRTLRIRDQFADETGRELSLNTFLSNDKAEVLDVASLPALVPREVRERYGVFGIHVKPPWARGPHELFDLPAGSFRWIRAGDHWTAVKRYDDDIALTWLAGHTRRVDRRWRRLDHVVNGLG
jgi:hypothetical protein